MPDMLVKLYELPRFDPILQVMEERNITIRLGIPPEKHVVLDWIREHFSEAWASEADVAFSQKPTTIYLAIEQESQKLVGFGCFETTCKGFFGPTGVHPDYRGREIGKALLMACLHGLAHLGYAYGVIGGAGPVDFYQKTVGATEIPGSVPGIYRGMLRR
ncbi:MAG TPA: GNAT family N-acetyltransferase [Limnochordia bacterium]|nr:GNAT family N-acetyltransferase [Limnochordia bacterium]